MERLRADSAVPDFANHDVRRTISTYLMRTLDIPTDVVTAILNHRLSGPKANENYVQALPVRRMRTALEDWGEYLRKLQSEPRPCRVRCASATEATDAHPVKAWSHLSERGGIAYPARSNGLRAR